MIRRSVITCLFIGLMFSCSNGRSGLLPPDTMKVVMWDMLKIDELYTHMVVKDSSQLRRKTNIRLYEEVFRLHNITREQFQKTYHYYESHPTEFKVLIDSVEAHAERERNKPGAPPLVN